MFEYGVQLLPALHSSNGSLIRIFLTNTLNVKEHTQTYARTRIAILVFLLRAITQRFARSLSLYHPLCFLDLLQRASALTLHNRISLVEADESIRNK